MSPRTRMLCAAVLAALMLLAGAPAAADAFPNGRAPQSALAEVHVPGGKAYMTKAPAAALNTMRVCAVLDGVDIYPTLSTFRPNPNAYRTYYVQDIFKKRYGRNAATPGTSNHGWGLAIDLGFVPKMRPWIDRHGAFFGFAKRWSDASWEPWHIRWRAGVWKQRPDPGLSQRNPILRKGSGGRCIAIAVKEVQRRLRALGYYAGPVDGEFGAATAKGVRRLQRDRGMKKDGIVGPKVWAVVRSKTRGVKRPTEIKRTPQPFAGVDCRALQGLLTARLSELGLERPTIDGVCGKQTLATLEGYQRARGIPVTKKADKLTWKYLQRPFRLDGPDVSVHQGSVNWKAVRQSGRELAIVKASEGADFLDRTFSAERTRAIERAGLVWTAYHFLRPRAGRSGKVEARFFVRTAVTRGWGKGELPLVADIESTTLAPAATCTYLRQFLEQVRSSTGVRPIVYTFASFAKATLGKCGSWLRRHVLWIAHYGAKRPAAPWSWTLWQFTDRHVQPGASGRVDMNVMRGGVDRLNRLRVK